MEQETQFPPPPSEIKALTLLGRCPMSGDQAKFPACIRAKTIYVTFAHPIRQNSIYLSTLLSEERLNPCSRSLHMPRYYSLHKTLLLHTLFKNKLFRLLEDTFITTQTQIHHSGHIRDCLSMFTPCITFIFTLFLTSVLKEVFRWKIWSILKQSVETRTIVLKFLLIFSAPVGSIKWKSETGCCSKRDI
jgi:hypothetical protein